MVDRPLTVQDAARLLAAFGDEMQRALQPIADAILSTAGSPAPARPVNIPGREPLMVPAQRLGLRDPLKMDGGVQAAIVDLPNGDGKLTYIRAQKPNTLPAIQWDHPTKGRMLLVPAGKGDGDGDESSSGT